MAVIQRTSPSNRPYPRVDRPPGGGCAAPGPGRDGANPRRSAPIRGTASIRC